MRSVVRVLAESRKSCGLRPLEHLGQELPEDTAAGGCPEKLLGRSRLDDLTMVHEVHGVGRLTGEAYLVVTMTIVMPSRRGRPWSPGRP
jgi:hypothetical protein